MPCLPWEGLFVLPNTQPLTIDLFPSLFIGIIYSVIGTAPSLEQIFPLSQLWVWNHILKLDLSGSWTHFDGYEQGLLHSFVQQQQQTINIVLHSGCLSRIDYHHFRLRILTVIESPFCKKDIWGSGTRVYHSAAPLIYPGQFLFQLMRLWINGMWILLVWDQPPPHHLWMGQGRGRPPLFSTFSGCGPNQWRFSGWKPWNQCGLGLGYIDHGLKGMEGETWKVYGLCWGFLSGIS